MSDGNELPLGWVNAPLSAIGTWLGGGTPSKWVSEYWQDGTIHWVSPKDMKRLLIDSAQDQITEAAVRQSAKNLVPKDSVLMVTRSGILEHTFPVAVNVLPVAINQDLKAWTPSGDVSSIYVACNLKANAQAILNDCCKDGTNLDIFWLKDESLDDVDSLPSPDVIAAEIIDNLQAALEAFQSVAEELAAPP